MGSIDIKESDRSIRSKSNRKGNIFFFKKGNTREWLESTTIDKSKDGWERKSVVVVESERDGDTQYSLEEERKCRMCSVFPFYFLLMFEDSQILWFQPLFPDRRGGKVKETSLGGDNNRGREWEGRERVERGREDKTKDGQDGRKEKKKKKKKSKKEDDEEPREEEKRKNQKRGLEEKRRERERGMGWVSRVGDEEFYSGIPHCIIIIMEYKMAVSLFYWFYSTTPYIFFWNFFSILHCKNRIQRTEYYREQHARPQGENWQIRPPTKFHSLTPTIVTRSGESAGSSCAVWSDSCCLSINTVQTVWSSTYRITTPELFNYSVQNTQQCTSYCVYIKISRQINAFPSCRNHLTSLSPWNPIHSFIQRRNEVPSLHCPVGHAVAFLSTGSSAYGVLTSM